MKWNWLENCQTAFDEIKKLLTFDLSFVYLDLATKVVLSENTIGAVMLHRYKDGNMKAVPHILYYQQKKIQPNRKRSFSNYFCCKRISQIFKR